MRESQTFIDISMFKGSFQGREAERGTRTKLLCKRSELIQNLNE